MDNQQLVRNWMIVVGVALVAAGVLGFIPNNPIASKAPDALFRTNELHNLIHLASGALALGIAFGTRGRALADWTIGFGVLYAVILVLLIIDPTLFGLFADAPANGADHVLHAAIAVVSIAVGYMARERREAVVR